MNALRPHEGGVLLRRALRCLGSPDDPDDAELRVRILISLAYSDAEERGFDNGLRHLGTATTVLPLVPDPGVRAALDATIEAQHGALLMRVGRFAESVEVLDRAVAVGERAAAQGFLDAPGLSTNLLNRGLAAIGDGRPAPARRDLLRSIEVAEDGMRTGEEYARLALLAAKAHHNLGVVAWRVNDIPRALRHYRDAEVSFTEHDPSLVPQLRMAQADALLAAGLAEEAARYLDEALPQMRRQGDHRNLAVAELTRASAALVDGDHATARRFAGSARRRLLRSSPSWAAIAALIGLRSQAVDALRRPKVPPALPARALGLADELAALRLADESAMARMLAVRLLIRRRDAGEAARQLALVPAPRQVTPVDHRMLLRLCRAELAVATGRRRSAFGQANGGLAELSRVRDRMGGLELVSGTAVYGRELGELAVRLVLDQRRSAARRLFVWLERTRAQIYRYEPLPPLDDPELTERVQRYRMLSRELREARLRGERPGELITRHAALQREVQRLGWGDGPWGRARPIAELDDVVAELGDRALLSFVVSGQRIAAVVVIDGRVRLVRLGAMADVTNAARELRADLDALSPDHLPGPIAAAVTASARVRAARLDEQLLGPLAGVLGDRELVVVPTGDLYAVVWGALPSLRGRPVSVAPSATAWLTAMRTQARSPADRTVLAAGPHLRAAEAEIGGLREYYPGATMLDGEKAGVRDVLAALDGARLAHLAAHGTHEPENALFSWLELADGALYAHEIARLRRPPEHVVLAACELALARIRPGDEALGFAGALLAIGSRTVTAPVTRVGDLAAAAAMTDYHRRLAGGAAPAVALAETTAVDPLHRPFVSLGASRPAG
jgi:tetratricopeptide (TPR) repeat protein